MVFLNSRVGYYFDDLNFDNEDLVDRMEGEGVLTNSVFQTDVSGDISMMSILIMRTSQMRFSQYRFTAACVTYQCVDVMWVTVRQPSLTIMV